jgi:NTE family protein
MSPRIALCLPGGGAMGALYQIGALSALEDAVDGFDAGACQLYVGSSSGASLAVALAAGVPVQRLYRAFLDPADVYFGLESRHLLRLDRGEWQRTLSTTLVAFYRAAKSALAREPKDMLGALLEERDRLYDSLPAGLFTLQAYERFLRDFFARRGVASSFSELPRPVRVLAHDLEGAEVLIVVHAMVPVSVNRVPTGHGHGASLRDKGMMWVLNQAIRIGMQRLVEESSDRLSRRSDVTVLRIEPDAEDGGLFLHSPVNFDARRRLLEHAYRTTRAELFSRFAASEPGLARAGLRPKTPIRPSPASISA